MLRLTVFVLVLTCFSAYILYHIQYNPVNGIVYKIRPHFLCNYDKILCIGYFAQLHRFRARKTGKPVSLLDF